LHRIIIIIIIILLWWLAGRLMELGHKLSTDGTDNHLLLWNLRPHGISGSKLERVCELAGITLNKNRWGAQLSLIF
jgi:glycine hydroxymethyltransferase